MTVRMFGAPKTWMSWPCFSGFGGTTWSPIVQLKPTLIRLWSSTHPRW